MWPRSGRTVNASTGATIANSVAAPLPAAPNAVLSIGRGELNPPLGIRDFTQLLFDGSQSTGEGLTYLLEFGDGATSSEPTARHRSKEPGPLDARLTVTNKYGRTDSTTETHYRVPVVTESASWWENEIQSGRRTIERQVILARDGAALSGRYVGLEGRKRLAGELSGDRAIRLRTQDGAIELAGMLEWKSRDELYAVCSISASSIRIERIGPTRADVYPSRGRPKFERDNIEGCNLRLVRPHRPEA